MLLPNRRVSADPCEAGFARHARAGYAGRSADTGAAIGERSDGDAWTVSGMQVLSPGGAL